MHYESPRFSVMKSTTMGLAGVFGVLGGLFAGGSALSEGERMRREYGLQDPAVLIKQRLASQLREEVGPTEIEIADSPVQDDDIDGLKRRFVRGTVLDVRTKSWMLLYGSTDWSHYGIAYTGRARVISLERPTIVWEGDCKVQPEPTRSLEELTANGGALLGNELEMAASECVRQLRAALLGGS